MSEENAPYNAGHDPTVALRLELGRMTDKANAFEAALRKEVLAVVAQEVAKAKACDAEIARLKAENALLNTVIESHKDAGKRLLAMLDEERRNSSRLKAEVERLDSLCDNLGMGGKHTIMAIMEENARLKAEVENFKEYLKWHADGHKFNAWEIWRRQQSDAGEGKLSV